MILRPVIDQDLGAGSGELGSGLGLGIQHRSDDLGLEGISEPGATAVLIVLGGDDQVLQGHRTLAVVADGHLRLAVGPQARHDPLLTHQRQALGQTMGEVDRQRHEGGGVIAGVAEHESLVPGALQVEGVDVSAVLAGLKGLVHSGGDIRGLLADRHRDPAGSGIEADLRGGVADGRDLLTDDLRNLHISALGGHLSGHVHQAGGHHGLNGDARSGVLLKDRVEDGVGDTIADLVRVSFGDRLGGEQTQGGTHPPIVVTTGTDPWWRYPRKRTAGFQEPCSRPAVRSTRRRATSILLPCPRATSEPWASRTTTALGTSPKPRSSPTALTARRWAPFRRALAAPWKSTSPSSSPVSAANPTTT